MTPDSSKDTEVSENCSDLCPDDNLSLPKTESIDNVSKY